MTFQFVTGPAAEQRMDRAAMNWPAVRDLACRIAGAELLPGSVVIRFALVLGLRLKSEV